MEIILRDKVAICLLRNLSYFFDVNDYSPPVVIYASRDGSYLYFEGNGSKNKHIIITIDYGGELKITFSRVKNAGPLLAEIGSDILGMFKVPYFKEKLKPGAGGRDVFVLTEFMRRYTKGGYIHPRLTEENYEKVILSYKEYFERYLLQVLRGEKWFDDLLVENVP